MKINGVPFEREMYTINELEDSEGLKCIDLEFEVYGETNFNLYRELFKNDIYNIEFEDGANFIFEKTNNITRHSTPLTVNTKVDFTVSLKEKKELEEGASDFSILLVNTMHLLISSFTNQRALVRLLIDKELITREEYEKYCDESYESDFDEIKGMIQEGTKQES